MAFPEKSVWHGAQERIVTGRRHEEKHGKRQPERSTRGQVIPAHQPLGFRGHRRALLSAGAAPGNQALLGAPHHAPGVQQHSQPEPTPNTDGQVRVGEDRKSTRLNSSHITISYAVFCLKKKKKNKSNSYNHKNITHTITH